MIDYLEALVQAIRQKYHCDADYVMTVPVVELVDGKKVWDGAVEIFNLRLHPKAKRCFAWGVRKGDGLDITTVLEIPPAISPHTAVKAVLADKLIK